MGSEHTRLTILFGVPEGVHIARELVRIAAALPGADCHFVGISWCTGIPVRHQGFTYSHLPWYDEEAPDVDPVPPVMELLTRGFSPDTTPLPVRRTLASLERLLASAIERCRPDLIIYGPLEHAVCHLVARLGRERGIPGLGIQTGFLADRFLVQIVGMGWEDELRTAAIPPTSDAGVESTPAPSPRPAGRNLAFCLRGVERLVRVLLRSPSFDTPASLLHAIGYHLSSHRWLPSLSPLAGEEAPPERCLVVALHQPALPWSAPGWVDLLAFALAAVPEEMPIVIRPHPRELVRKTPQALEQQLAARGARLSLDGQGPDLDSLLGSCTALMTLTSATGITALQSGVPVLALGPAYYARPGLARPVILSDAPEVKELLRHPEGLRPDPDAVRSFVTWLRCDRMIPAPSGDPDRCRQVVGRIMAMVDSHHGSPAGPAGACCTPGPDGRCPDCDGTGS